MTGCSSKAKVSKTLKTIGDYVVENKIVQPNPDTAIESEKWTLNVLQYYDCSVLLDKGSINLSSYTANYETYLYYVNYNHTLSDDAVGIEVINIFKNSDNSYSIIEVRFISNDLDNKHDNNPVEVSYYHTTRQGEYYFEQVNMKTIARFDIPRTYSGELVDVTISDINEDYGKEVANTFVNLSYTKLKTVLANLNLTYDDLKLTYTK